ncbi:MAG: uncharacterized protein QOF57_992 [Frankiaceae bacterium]|nr:uncharacterized protein [Frankiaceae bacterium]
MTQTTGGPALRGVVMGAHEWRDVTFLHWRYDAADIQRLLPHGLTVETRDGSAWVGLVLLRMRVGPPLTRLIRPAIRVLEANLRTYVTGPDGEPGVYFLSIDCDRWSVCTGGRAVGVRYLPARQHMSREQSEVHYWGARYGGRASYDIAVDVGDPMIPGDVDDWLTARFAVYGALGPALVRVPATHAAWPLRTATLQHADETLLAAAGLQAPVTPPLVHFSRGVTDVVLGLPTVFTPSGG